MPFFLLYIGSWLSLTGGIYGLFDKAGKVVHPDTKKASAQWLKNLDLPEELPNWPAIFAETFDSVFTRKHLSWGCFWRSCVASVVAVAIVTLTVAAVGGRSFFREEILESFGGAGRTTFFLFALFTLTYNLLPDYLSLFETRLVIGWIGKSNAGLRTLALLLFDVAATALIFFVVGLVVMTNLVAIIMSIFISTDVGTLTKMTEAFWNGLRFSGSTPKAAGLGIFIYSTFFTSVWVWLYALSGFLIKLITRLRGGLHFLQKHLNLEEHPLRSMGLVLILLVTVGYLIGAVFIVL